MKLNDVKHNHSLTDLLKVILFSLIMLLPFLDVGTRCAYVIANKNAYQSYSGINGYEQTEINTLEIGNQYNFNNLNLVASTNGSGTLIGYSNVENVSTTISNLQNYLNTYHYFRPYWNSSGVMGTIYFYSDDLSTSYGLNMNGFSANFNFTLESYNPNEISNLTWLRLLHYENYDTLDNVFEYSVSQLEESNLYNWTTQTAIYSGVSQMTTQLGITTNIIPIIIVYWFFITIIYIILDIVIRLFTILTHFIGSKTA